MPLTLRHISLDKTAALNWLCNTISAQFEIKNSTEVGFNGMCNNAVTRLDTPPGTPPAYVMAIESNGGPLVGKAYLMATFAYLNSSDLSSGWTQFPPTTHHYTRQEVRALAYSCRRDVLAYSCRVLC